MEVITRKSVDIQYLEIYVSPRYLEDSVFNGQDDDEKGTLVKQLVPGIVVEANEGNADFIGNKGDICIRLLIEIETGRITNWNQGVTSRMHYKSVDCNHYYLLDEDKNVVASCEYSYVLGTGVVNEYGDYFVPEIDDNGFIEGWNKLTAKRIIDDMNELNKSE